MQSIIDPHIHLFNVNKGEYLWLKPENQPNWPDKNKINKSFSTHDLRLNNGLFLRGLVHIEAGFDNNKPEYELAWLENDVFTCINTIQYKTIAFANLLFSSEAFLTQLNTLEKYKSLLGVRFIFDENHCDVGSFRRFSDNLKVLEKRRLHFELQCNCLNTPLVDALIRIFSCYPNLKVTLGHAGFAPINKRGLPSNSSNSVATFNNSIEPSINNSYNHHKDWQIWKNNMCKFAKLQNMHIKCSGFEMITRSYKQEHVEFVLNQVHRLFSPSKIMLASNFPLTLFSYTYQQYWELVIASSNALGLNTHALVYENARTFYGIEH